MNDEPWTVKDVSWVVAIGSTNLVKCLRCGEELHINLPQRVEVWVAAVRAFVDLHSGCREDVEAFIKQFEAELDDVEAAAKHRGDKQTLAAVEVVRRRCFAKPEKEETDAGAFHEKHD